MNTVFPYGNWVWCVISEESDSDVVQNEGFIIANSKDEALRILGKDLSMEYNIPFELQGDKFVGTSDGVKLWTYVEPISCLNPEACGK